MALALKKLLILAGQKLIKMTTTEDGRKDIFKIVCLLIGVLFIPVAFICFIIMIFTSFITATTTTIIYNNNYSSSYESSLNQLEPLETLEME